jgi:hypothetical protein
MECAFLGKHQEFNPGALESNIAFRHFDRSNFAQRRLRLPDKDIGEVEQIIVLESHDRRFDRGKALRSAGFAIAAPSVPFIPHCRRLAGGWASR